MLPLAEFPAIRLAEQDAISGDHGAHLRRHPSGFTHGSTSELDSPLHEEPVRLCIRAVGGHAATVDRPHHIRPRSLLRTSCDCAIRSLPAVWTPEAQRNTRADIPREAGGKLGDVLAVGPPRSRCCTGVPGRTF